MWNIRGLFSVSLAGLGIFLIAVGIAAIVVAGLVRHIFRLSKDSRAPRLTVEATVIGRRREDRFYGTKHRRTRSSTYHAVFLLKNGMRHELWMGRRNYKRLVDGSFGMLTYQGSRFVKFEPMEKQVTE